MRRTTLIAVVASLMLVLPATTAAHYTGTDHRSQMFLFMETSNIPTSWEYPINVSFGEWDGVPGDCHDFRRGFGQIAVDRGGYDGAGSTFAYVNADHNYMYFDWGETWYAGATGSPGSSLDLRSIATHEAGHTLRLGHTSTVNDTMYAYYSYGQTHARDLSSNDIGREQNLYQPGTCTM